MPKESVLKILLYSEQVDEAEVIKNMILAINSKLEVLIAANVNQAMNYANVDGPFALYLLDFDTQTDINALGLNLVEMTGKRPLIFLGREAILKDLVSDELFHSHQKNNKLLKPTTRADFPTDLKQQIDTAIEWARKEEFDESIKEVDPNDYLPMKIKSFFLYESFPYDLYLAITTKSYIKIISADKTYTHATLTKYSRKNVKYLYIKKDDQIKYLEEESKKCLKAMKLAKPEDKGIYLLLLRAVTILHQFILALGVTDSVLVLTNVIAETIVNQYKSQISLKPILKSYPTFYQGVASKSLLTAFIAQAIAWKVGWESNTTKMKLVVCALLQDITLPEESMAKANSLKSEFIKGHDARDIEEYKVHPLKAAEFAKQFTNFPDIDYIIEAHHELPNRKGFPNRPSSSRLTQICAVFNVAQHIAAELDGEKLSDIFLQKVTRPMIKTHSGGHFRDIVKIAISEVRLK
tara:strand:- start:2550 stop:3944 length:1395 start_codon:yes stop_codon:yes gene_type:complete